MRDLSNNPDKVGESSKKQWISLNYLSVSYNIENFVEGLKSSECVRILLKFFQSFKKRNNNSPGYSTNNAEKPG